jgi:ABC-type branched-subunit amino acid transport system substrate-binding protein
LALRLALTAVVALAVSACAVPREDVRRPAPLRPAVPQGPAPVDPMQPVTVALLVPQGAAEEGPAALARALVSAARMAEQDLNDPRLRLRLYDTAGRPEIAAAAADRAIADGADLILGPLFAVNTREVGRIAAAAGVKVLSFSNDATVAGGPVYVTGFTPASEVRRVLGYAASRGLRSVAVFAPLTDEGDAALRGVDDAQARGLVRVVATRSYERSFKGIEAASEGFAAEARAGGAEAILLPSGGSELQAVGSFMNYHALDPLRVQYLGTHRWKARASFEEPALEGGWFAAADPALEARFSERYMAQTGERAPPLAFLGYDAVTIAGTLLAEARQRPGSAPFSPQALMRPEGFDGALGPVRFLPGGVAERALAVLAVGAGTFDVLDPAPMIVGAGL